MLNRLIALLSSLQPCTKRYAQSSHDVALYKDNRDRAFC